MLQQGAGGARLHVVEGQAGLAGGHGGEAAQAAHAAAAQHGRIAARLALACTESSDQLSPSPAGEQ